MERSRSALAPLIDDLATRGDRTALLHLQEDESIAELRYEDLARQVARAASGVVRQGVGRGESVALLAGNGLRWVVACLALIRAGAVPVPLDTQLDDETLERILSDCEARVVLTDRRNEARVAAVAGDHTVVVLDADESDDARDSEEGQHETMSWPCWIARGSGAEPAVESSTAADTRDDGALPDLRGDDRAILFYTSGTTGPPKGVPLAHRHVAFQIDAVREADLVNADDRVLLPLPLHHVYPLVVGLLCPLSLGLPVIFPHSLTGPALLRALDAGGATIVIGVPRIYEALLFAIEQRIGGRSALIGTALEQLVRAATWTTRRLRVPVGRLLFAPLRRRLGPRLRVLASGGSALPPAVGFRLEGLGFRVASGYGLTETSPLLTLNPPGSGHLESVGRPIRGVEIRIDRAAHPAKDERASEDGAAEARAGPRKPVEGEILARGPGVFDGYLNLEEETRESFTEDGWLRTGDLGFFDEARHLHVTGRKSTLIVTSAGEKIRTEEVEKAYAEHAFIDEIGIFDREGSLAAVVVPARDAIRERERDLEEAIVEALNERAATLPSHERIDDFVTTPTALERTRLGKLRRHRLRERYEELREKGSEAEPSEPIAVDQMSGEDRELLQDDAAREVWSLLATRFPDRGLTPDASPRLDLGVDSLGWLDLTVGIAERTGVELDEERIAGIETVRDLLRAVAEAKPQEQPGARAPLEDPHAVLDERQERWLTALPRPAALAARGLSALNRGIMRRVFRLEVDGIEYVEQLPPDSAFVIAPNHSSYLDPLAVAAALPEPLRERTFWGGWTGVVFRNALLRGSSRLARAVPVDPDRGVTSSLAFAAATLEQGSGLVWFPEGQRSTDGGLQEFRPGIGMLLDAFDDVPVVPAHIDGSHEAWPPGQRLPRPARLRVRFGRPRKASDLAERGEGEEPRDRIASGLRAAVRELAGDRA